MKKSKQSADLPTSKKDEEKLKSDKTTLPLPDVGDIPGQEHVQAMPAGEMADTTISSADEEADELFANGEEAKEGNVTDAERKALRDAANHTPGVLDDENLKAAELDQTDDDGTPLNEDIDRSGSDLDVPGSEADDADEAIGEEDEENNSYSLGGESEDDSVQKQ